MIMRRSARLLLLALLLPATLPGCPSPPKDLALQTVTELEAAVKARESSWIQETEKVLIFAFTRLRDEQEARWEARLVKTKLKIYRQAGALATELHAYSRDQIEKSLEPELRIDSIFI